MCLPCQMRPAPVCPLLPSHSLEDHKGKNDRVSCSSLLYQWGPKGRLLHCAIYLGQPRLKEFVSQCQSPDWVSLCRNWQNTTLLHEFCKRFQSVCMFNYTVRFWILGSNNPDGDLIQFLVPLPISLSDQLTVNSPLGLKNNLFIYHPQNILSPYVL